MGILRRIQATGMMLILFLSGCGFSNTQKPPTYRVITQIQVDYQGGPLQAQWLFSSPEKMQLSVDYLRSIAPYGSPSEVPEEMPGSDFQIELLYSDGSSCHYHQRADRFMRIGDGPWKRIEPQKALELSQILGQLSSDPPTVDISPIPPVIRPQI